MADEPWRDAVGAVLAGCAPKSIEAAIEHVTTLLADGASATHAADLALAFATAQGDAVAVRRLERHVAGELVAAARAIDRDQTFVDEVCQQTRVRLLVRDGSAPPRIASYRGAGPLRAWVAIAARRVALNAKRDVDRPAGDDVLAEIVDREPDPELRHLRTLYRTEFREALTAALSGLADRTRAVLRLRFVDGLDLAQIGRLYRVHESTVSRWISSALDEVGRVTRAQLVARLAVTPDTASSVARMVQSGLDLSIARLLRE